MLSWKLSITVEAAFCVEVLEEALATHGKPDMLSLYCAPCELGASWQAGKRW